MVKVGFICEGFSEKYFVDSEKFKLLLKKMDIQKVGRTVDAKGNGNLLPHNIEKYNIMLKKKEAEKIIILADLETDPCVTKTKERIEPDNFHVLIVEKKKIESWFLSDSTTLKKI